MANVKQSKEERLAESLAAGRQHLEAAKARLCPLILAAEAEVAFLREKLDEAEQDRDRAYKAHDDLKAEVTKRLGLDPVPATLVEKMRAFVESHGFRRANVNNLVSRWRDRTVDALDNVTAAREEKNKTGCIYDAVYRKWNVAKSPNGSLHHLRSEYERALHISARDRRKETREAEQIDRDTAKALEIIDQFSWSAEK